MEQETEKLKEILSKVNLNILPVDINKSNYLNFTQDISRELSHILTSATKEEPLRWCFSTVKKAKVFVIIFQANSRGDTIYKEEIAKLLPEYSYKTIATIIDEGIARGHYISMQPSNKQVSDKKIKNIRPSESTVTAFLNWNIERIVGIDKLIKKYK
jgi:hypothetical protein|tara:strand:- start:19 stop:489 length:471 start_codon:yes stop_codon:yes gene_type:complete